MSANERLAHEGEQIFFLSPHMAPAISTVLRPLIKHWIGKIAVPFLEGIDTHTNAEERSKCSYNT